MNIRKITADRIFDGNKLISDHVLLIDNEGLVVDLVPAMHAGEGAESFQGILCPGLINSHCHLELSHLRGRIPEKTGLVDFVYRVMTERHHPEQEIVSSIARAEDEMLASGIVAVGDISNNTLTIPQKQKGRLYYHNFIEASGWLPEVAQTRLDRAKLIYDAFAGQLRPSSTSMSPHAPYSVSTGLWERLMPWFENRIVTIHNQETAFEDEFFMHGTGDFTRLYEKMKIDNSHHVSTKRTSLQSYFEFLRKASSVILVHNTFIRQADIDFVRETSAIEQQTFPNESGVLRSNIKPQTHFCLCINANQYIEDAVPPVELLRNNNCNIVLGTDSLASNWSLSILDEMKTIKKFFPAIALEELLQWATINGARALQIDDVYGSFKKGKRPGVVLIDEEMQRCKRIS